MRKLKVTAWYKDTWSETIEIDVPDDATEAQANAIRRRAVERHQPAGPSQRRLSPCNWEGDHWEGDPVFPREVTRGDV